MANKWAAGLAAGTLTGFALFFMTVLELIFRSGQRFDCLSTLLPGYSVSPAGAFIGLVWGFLDGFIIGFLFASLYNLFAPSKK
jgi:hypothetical protein